MDETLLWPADMREENERLMLLFSNLCNEDPDGEIDDEKFLRDNASLKFRVFLKQWDEKKEELEKQGVLI